MRSKIRNTLIIVTGLVLALAAPAIWAQSYEYDAAGRLIRVAYPEGGGIAYTYDDSDNMTAAMPLTLPPAPTGVEVSRESPDSARITWEADSSASRYVIERRLVGGTQWEEIATVSASVTSFVDLGLSPNEEYVYRVAAIGADGRSAFSDEVSSEDPSLRLRLLLSSGGGRTVTTLGESAEQRTGYATVGVNSGEAPYGVAVFSFTTGGVVVSEAGVPASPPSQRTRIFIDYRTNVTLSTPQSTGTISVTTGIGVANPGGSEANITYTLRDASGVTLTVGRGTLAAGAHFAQVINNFQSVAPDFDLPANFPTAVGFGTLDVESDQPLSVMAIRGTTNQRGELLLTTTPVADLSVLASSDAVLFPHLADSVGFTTLFFLLNTTGSEQTGIIELFDDQGNPLTITPVSGSPGSTFRYTIPAGGIFLFESDGSASSHRTGWVRLSPTGGSTVPVGAGAFQAFKDGILVSESGIPSATPTTRARIYVDRSSGRDNGVAIAIPGAAGTNVTVDAFELDGSTPAGSGSTTFPMNGRGHRADLAGGFISGLPEGYRGVFEISSDRPFVALNLRALINSRGELLLTTFPIADMTRAAPFPVIFPHFADGGGFKTELILQSAGGGVEVIVRFVADDGLPVPVEDLGNQP